MPSLRWGRNKKSNRALDMTDPTYQSQELWKALNSLPRKVWKDTPGGSGDPPPWREIAQLLCSAAWHFELAEKLQTPFSSKKMTTLLGKKAPWPWGAWLKYHQAFGHPPTEGHPWVTPMWIDSIPGKPVDGRSLIFIQSTLLGDVALRLAGSWEILRDGKYHKPPKTWASSIIDPIIDKSLDSLLDTCGKIKYPTTILPIMKQLLIVVAFRDSFMHGEISDKSNKRRKYRDLWIGSKEYTPKVIGEACLGVWKGILNIVKTNI
jgi:hypothetical protein